MTSPTTNNPELVIGLVSVSDRASGGVYEDKGIPALQDWLRSALTTPFRVETRLIPDDRASLRAIMRDRPVIMAWRSPVQPARKK